MIRSPIPEIRRGRPCDICSENTDVISEQLPLMASGATADVETGSYVQSNLCQTCKEEGWFVLSTCFRLVYLNSNTNKSKAV